MKKIISLVLCLMLLVPSLALAATGDAVIARRNYENQEEGFQDYIETVCTAGDTLYLFGGSGVYTYQTGDADVTAHEYAFDADSDEAMLRGNTIAAFQWNDALYCLRAIREWTEVEMEDSDETYTTDSVSGLGLYAVTFNEDGTVSADELALELDSEELIVDEGDWVYMMQINSVVQVGDYLILCGYDDMGERFIYRADLNDGSGDFVDIRDAYSMAPYKDGMALVQCYSWEEGKNQQAELLAYDPETDETESIITLEVSEYRPLNGMVYSEEDDLLYAVKAGCVWSIDLTSGEWTEITDMPLEIYEDRAAQLMGGHYYVASTYEGTVIRNVKPSDDEKAAYTLRIYDSQYTNAVSSTFFDFTNQHGEAQVIKSTEYIQPDQILEEMMNRSGYWDIFILNCQNPAYDAMYNRGFMASLQGSEALAALADSMYPGVRERLSRNGELVAIPVEIYSDSMGCDLKALEKIGLTEDDLPTNWWDLLDFIIEELPGRLEGSGVTLFDSGMDANQCRQNLFSSILTDYMHYLDYVGQEVGFNTDLLRGLLEKLDRIDFVALGQPEEIDWENWEYEWTEHSTLFNSYMSLGVDNSFTDGVPLLLSMDAESPRFIAHQGSVAFVNPFSEHQEEAILFLEAMAQHLNNNLLYCLIPDLNEPIRSSYYEEAKKNAEDYLASLKEQYETAEDEDKQMLEEMIAEEEQYYQNMDDWYWEVSPAGLAWYRAHDDYVMLQGYNALYGSDSSEIQTLAMQYLEERSIDAATFLKGIDKKLQMMILENQ